MNRIEASDDGVQDYKDEANTLQSRNARRREDDNGVYVPHTGGFISQLPSSEGAPLNGGTSGKLRGPRSVRPLSLGPPPVLPSSLLSRLR
jgi:hypothetical protein